MCHVKRAGYFAVDRARLNINLFPDFLSVFRSSLKPSLDTEGFAVLKEGKFRHLMSEVIDILAFGLDAPFVGNTDQLFGILNLIVSTFFCLIKCVADLTAVKFR